MKKKLPRRYGRILVALATSAVGAAASALPAAAASSTTSLSLTGGSLSIGTLTATTINSNIGGTSTGNLPYGSWTDATGLGAGWNGSIALSLFHYQGNWTQTAGTTTSLGSNTSGDYTGSSEGSYTVTVTGYTSPLLSFSYAGLESGTGTATLLAGNVASSIGTKGVTITWAPLTTTYAAGMTYSIQVGNLPSTALSLNNASGGSIVATGGTTSPAPAFTNKTATPAEGALVGDPTQNVGTATKFLTAAVNQGVGSFTVTPSASITSDSFAWAQTYTAQVTYTISSGP